MTVAILMDVVGYVGGALILAGYFLLSAGKVTAKSASYHATNIVGASGLIANSAWHDAWPPALLNVVYVGIGIVALASIVTSRGARA